MVTAMMTSTYLSCSTTLIDGNIDVWLYVNVSIIGLSMRMMIDSGATENIIDEQSLTVLGSNIVMQKSNIGICAYGQK